MSSVHYFCAKWLTSNTPNLCRTDARELTPAPLLFSGCEQL
jgi:hypothetical protein